MPVQTKGEENQAVQKVTDTLGERAPTQKKYRLLPLNTNDQLYIYVETLEGDLIPQVVLYAYGSKPIRSANIGGNNQHAALEYTFPEKAQGYLIEVSAKPGTSGTYALYIGKNDPAVLTGNADVYGAPLLRQPIVASVGVKLQQIAGIDQKAENYSAVASTQITWNDPALAFRPDECECESKVYTANEFINYATQAGIVWPAFTYLNQQNNRWIQSDFVIVQPNGDARYFERFTTTFQAPDFDFRKFPFDNQSFFIRIDSLYASEFVTFTPSDFTGIGTQLGEEEWYITDHDVTIVTEPGSTGAKTASFIFRFYARRHLAFYIYRIILPLALIITVAWITFFLEDYGKRVDATTANLLLFIAFNFTIAGDLPRLGYLTYMDMLLAGAFTLSVLVVAYNVALKRWETKKKPVDWLFTMDKYMLWLYPLIYALTFGSITWYFFLQ
ncbi:MAG TPA: electron transporter RnfC [Anaerolineales bacterium]|nr:electron transporter RnfC [Anaerolineales bacterium]